MSNQGYQPIQNPYRGKNRQYSSYPSKKVKGQRSKGTIPVQKCNEKAVQLQKVKVRKINTPYWNFFQKTNGYYKIEPGYKIEFFQRPLQTFFPKQIHFNAVESEMVSKEVKQLVDIGAIEEVKDISDYFISNIFLVPKNMVI